MTQREKKQSTLLAFLTDNMREMETELRAQSIVLEALAQGVIGVHEMERALSWARGSTSMLKFVENKYATVGDLCSTQQDQPVTEDAVIWPEPRGVSKLPN